MELDPVSPIVRFVLSRAELEARLFKEAAASSRRAVQIDSLFPLAASSLAAAEYFLGHREVARQVALRSSAAPAAGPYRAYVLSATGDDASRAALLRTLAARRGSDSHVETSLAAVYLGAGDSSRALDALTRAAARREPISASTGFGSSICDPIRASARFTAILRAYGVDPAAVNSVAPRPTR